MTCNWGRHSSYIPLSERFKPGKEYNLACPAWGYATGTRVTVLLQNGTHVIVRPHLNPQDEILVPIDVLE